AVPLWMLRKSGPDEKATVRAAMDRKLVRRRPALVNEVLRGRVEVVEDVLLVAERAGSMPQLAFLAAAAQVGDRVDAPGFHPTQRRDGVFGRQADVKAAVAVEERGSRPVRCVLRLTRDDEHTNDGAVRRGVLDLACVNGWCVRLTWGVCPQRGFSGASVISVDTRRRAEVGVAEPCLMAA